MKDIEITKEGIVIIQWLNPGDPQLGEDLYHQLNHKETERPNYFVDYYKVDNRNEFVAVLQKLVDETKEGAIFTLHIVAHGYEDGIGTVIGTDEVRWGELYHYTRQLNVTMGNNLLLVLSSCTGGGILSRIEPEERAPYRAVVANTRPVEMADAQNGFAAFYADYYDILDFPKAIRALNAVIDLSEEIEPGNKKVEFFIMTAEQSFKEVFNPDRDPAFFASVVDKIMPPNPMIPQELRVEKAKEIFRKMGEELIAHFCFKD